MANILWSSPGKASIGSRRRRLYNGALTACFFFTFFIFDPEIPSLVSDLPDTLVSRRRLGDRRVIVVPVSASRINFFLGLPGPRFFGTTYVTFQLLFAIVSEQ